MGESARVSPVPAADVGRVLPVAATAVEDDADDDEDYNDDQLIHARVELLFCVAERSENVDEDEEQPEDGDPDGDVDARGAFPILNSDTGGGDFELRRSGATEYSVQDGRSEASGSAVT